ncbi:MAG: calcium-binding protein [Pirellulaceae bacterium]
MATILAWDTDDNSLLIDTGGNVDTVSFSYEEDGGTKYARITLNGISTKIWKNTGGTVFAETQEVESVEVKSGGGDDVIDASGITATPAGYDPKKLNGKIELKGQNGDDTITGSPFDDILEGRQGDDTMSGGQGNDVYNFDPDHPLGDDVILENANGGIDALDYTDAAFAISVDLNLTSSTNFQNVGTNHRLRFPNAQVDNIYAAHGPYDDVLKGNSLDNILQGRGGDDTIDGQSGDDHIEGGDGDDTLWGRQGADYINGGPGQDQIEGSQGDDVLQGDGFGDRVQDPNDVLEFPTGVDLDEASGLAVGRVNTNPVILWTIEDSGNPTYLYANLTNGTSRGYYNIKNTSADANNVDWEDLAFYRDDDDGKNYLYIADIGDNSAYDGDMENARSKITIYRVEEPTVSGTSKGSRGDWSFEVIDLQYPNHASAPRDAETFMIDPLSGDFYIVSKSEPADSKAHLYRASKPLPSDWSTDPDTAVIKTLVDEGATQFSANTKTNSPSGGDVSPDGKEVVIKSDDVIHIYKYDRVNNTKVMSISSLVTNNSPLQIVNALDKGNREAIAYTPDGNQLYTVSEAKKEASGPEARTVDVYTRVTDLIGVGPGTENLDTIVGGKGGNSKGEDWYIGVQTTSHDEVDDQDLAEPDLVLGVIGDMDFDGDVDFDDIDDFTTGLGDPSGYFGTWGIGAYVHGDIDGDGRLDFDDIDPFVALLT